MSENNQLRLPSHWSAVAFAVAWVAALSAYWIHIKMNVRFQALVGLGLGVKVPVIVDLRFGDPCGVPRPSSRLRVLRVCFPARRFLRLGLPATS